jgi:5-methylcytosine-specific restriction endonuclease McrA
MNLYQRLKQYHELHRDELPEWAQVLPTEQETALIVARTNLGKVPEGGASKYAAYLASPHWRTFRVFVLCLARGRCATCGSTATQVHHLTYVRRGNERISDVEPVCEACHLDEHGGLVLSGLTKSVVRSWDRDAKNAVRNPGT